MAQLEQARYLGRGIDYLGELGAKLRDLQSLATLSYELIQNADDAPGASWMSFDVRGEALVVDNDGVFSDCGRIEAPECAWKVDQSRGYRCDFHRFRLVASGDKRNQPDTAGAFGIGFIAAYQITDRPELISGGRHWILYEERPEGERIEVCPGCTSCRNSALPGTRFILPWAQNPNSAIRMALRAEAVTENVPTALLEELCHSLPTAMLFLKQLNSIGILQDGEPVRRFERIREDDSLIISDGTGDHVWHLLRGNFHQVADSVRRKHIGRIEAKRSSDVVLAIPDEPIEAGLMCAFLPTQHKTGLPFHINADFFTTNERKRIIFESEYQSEWNRAAIQAAAETLGAGLERIRDLLGHKRLWETIESVHRVAQEAAKGQREKPFAQFWACLAPALRGSAILLTTREEWRPAAQVLLLEKEEEETAVTILEDVGVCLVHRDLRPYFTLLRGADVGVQLLDIPHIIRALQDRGLTKRTEMKSAPELLQTRSGLTSLWKELGVLLVRRRSPEDHAKITRELAKTAIALGCDDALWPCCEIYQADEETIALFTAIDPRIPFLAEVGEEGEVIGGLCPKFTAKAALDQLSRLSSDALKDARRDGRLDPAALLLWFQARHGEILHSEELRRALSGIPLFPCAAGLRPLSALALPGDFKDPLGLTDLVDLDVLGGRREFLRDLGARELTFSRYAADHIPRAFVDPSLSTDKKREAVRLLAQRLGEIRDDQETRQTLAAIPIVECEDGAYCCPQDVFFRNSTVVEVLGDAVPFAVIPGDHESAVQELYRWLGVAQEPPFESIVQRITQLTTTGPKPDAVQGITTVFRHLGECLQKNSADTEPLEFLRSLTWLPARGQSSRWYRPEELCASFQDYLFESQAQFLDMPREVQNASVKLLDFLKIRSTPQVSQVVAHLLKCSGTGVAVNKEVYRFLNDNAKDAAVEKLKGQACLLLPDNTTYVRPSEVFWAEHPFGRFRHRLGPDLRRYSDLFGRLGVRDTPDYHDASDVIREIATEYGPRNRPLEESTLAVFLACWQMLDKALEEGALGEIDLHALNGLKVIPNSDRVLNPPEWMFFEDRAGLASKFEGFLQKNVISRPQGAWRAMAAAGVRALSTAVESHLIECTDPADHELLSRRIQQRKLLLARALEAQADGRSLLTNISMLDRIQCQSVRELKICFSLHAFNRERDSKPESVPAHFQREAGTLYFVSRAGEIPWPSIAREVALALCPDLEPGRLAPGIKEVLSPENEEDARSTLDELGFPPLEGTLPNVPPTAEVKDLGGPTTVPGREPTTVSQPVEQKQEPRAEPPLTPEEAVKQLLGPETKPPTSLPQELAETERKGGGVQGAGGLAQARPQGRFRTYVVSNGGGDANRSPGVSSQRDAVDQAGVNHVLEYERTSGRLPMEKPPNHPGYDVESMDAAGEVVRYIEVKSLSGKWGSLGAPMSKPQFEKASEFGDRFWLYVVERAEKSDFKIYRIQDPARLVNQFIYDSGWRALAEKEEAGSSKDQNQEDS